VIKEKATEEKVTFCRSREAAAKASRHLDAMEKKEKK
jgi:hypothetical protein